VLDGVAKVWVGPCTASAFTPSILSLVGPTTRVAVVQRRCWAEISGLEGCSSHVGVVPLDWVLSSDRLTSMA
jgi:hypothetical protein